MDRNHPFELAVPVSAVDHRIGPEHAPVTVVEYGDFECPNCKQAAPAVKQLLTRHGNRLRFVYRHFPLEMVHPHALAAAEASECAAAQGKFWEMHDLLFEHQQHLQLPQLRSYAQSVQLDMARYAAELDDHIYLQRVREQLDSGNRSGVRGTPTFYVNGRIQDVSFGIRGLFDGVERVLARANR
jgi:protein-disulfide isomerase